MFASKALHAKALAIVPAALILALATVALLALRQERRDTAAVRGTHDMIATSRSLLARLLAGESAVRAYVITGRSDHLERYERLREDLDSLLTALRASVPESGGYVSRIEEIEELTQSRLSVLDTQVVAAARRPLRTAAGGEPIVETMVGLVTTGDALSDSLQALMRSLDFEANRLRTSRIAASQRRADAGLLVVAVAVVVALVLSLLTNGLLLGSINRETLAARRLAAQNAELAEKNAQLAEREVELEAQTAQLADQAVELEQQTEHLTQKTRELDEHAELLRESEQRYRAILDAITDGAALHAADGSLVTVNKSAERILGLNATEIAAGSIDGWRFTREDGTDLDVEELPHRRVLQTRQPQPREVICVHRAERPPMWLYVTSVPISLRSGTGAVTTISDVTELRRTQAQLESDRGFYGAILESIDEAVIACDANGTLNFFNRAARELSHVSPDSRSPGEWAARYDFLHPNGTPMVLEELPLYRALQGEIVDDVEMTLAPPEGPPVRVVAAARPLSAGVDRLGAVVVLRNVTATRLAEEQLREADERLRQVQKMEAVGQLAGGIAHDFNNLLTAITSYAELAREMLPPDEPASADIGEILAAAERARVLTRQLLAFSRRQSFELRPVDVNAIVRRAETLLSRLLPASIERSTRTAPSPLFVESDPVQFEQVVINLAVNARDAIAGRGTIHMESLEVELDAAATAQIPELTPGRYALVSVTDDGCGMDPELQKRIFEPFFTTKPPGQGTGLGLSTVYGIVRQSRGTIVVYSEPGVGTTFKIYLPIAAREAAALTSPSPNPEVFGDETVLVVDDEAQVRTVIKRVLETRGFTVLDAGSAQEALALAERHEGPIDLLISDLVMPGMPGRDLADELRKSRPDLPVVFVSGYMAGMVGRLGATGPRTSFVQKPFSSSALLSAVGAALT